MWNTDYYLHQILHRETRRKLEQQAAQAQLTKGVRVIQLDSNLIVSLLAGLRLPKFAPYTARTQSSISSEGNSGVQCCVVQCCVASA